MLDQGFIDWLLAAKTPSIRYLTLHNLLGNSENNKGVQDVRFEMEDSGPIPVILSGQTSLGNWAGENSYYTPKFTSTHWNLVLLSELAADGSTGKMSAGVNFMLEATQQELVEKLEKQLAGWTCFYGNILKYALYCGMENDDRIKLVIKELIFDALEGDWCCNYNDNRPCAWGAARALWGLAEIPTEMRSSEVNDTIQSGLHFLLEQHDLVEADYPFPEGGKVHSIWSRLNFPLFYQADILFVLRVLMELDALHHPNVEPAIDWLVSRRNKNGNWRGSSPFKQRTWRELGDNTEVNRWVSLYSAMVIQNSQNQ